MLLLPWTTREAATLIILHDNTKMPGAEVLSWQYKLSSTYQETFCVLILT